jgi:hypothetical protein
LIAGFILALLGAPAKTRGRGYIECPSCAEMIKAKASICPYCRCDVRPLDIVIEQADGR